MKKRLILLLLTVVMCVGFTSCSDDDEAPVLGAYVGVTVKNMLGETLSGQDVYMFKNVKPGESTDLAEASKKVTTNADGLAGFKFNLIELNITESETPLYFAVYYKSGDNFILKAGDESVTVKRDDEKQITLVIPL